MKTGKITVQEFVAGSWAGGMFNRYQCLKCGAMLYINSLFRQAFKEENEVITEALESEIIFDGDMSCKTPCCQSRAVPISDNLSEITVLFDLCGYEISQAYERKFIESGVFRLFICIGFCKEYQIEIFPHLPKGWKFVAQDNDSSFIKFDRRQRNVSLWEQELFRDDALQSIFDWVSDIHSREIYKIWQIAELLPYNL